MSTDSRWNEYAEYIGEYLRRYYSTYHSEPQKRLYDAMEYSLFAGGKRLRPCLTFEFCRMCSGSWKEAAPLAGAIEMIHTYSLIHDDLPCMDNDDFRRGKLTNHKVFGDAIAVLAGDALLTDAFALACKADFPNSVQGLNAIAVLSECAGSRGMVGGQVLDVMSEERFCTEQEVLNIQSRKTGALIRAACILGVLAGGGSESQTDAARIYADYLGLAFQIRDDMLDIIGTKASLGKATGVDGSKNTFVRLYGLERCKELICDYTQRAVAALDAFENTQELVRFSENLTGRMH